MMLRARDEPAELPLWLVNGGDAAMRSYAPSDDQLSFEHIPDAHWEFLEHRCVDFYETDSHIFVHGGLDPALPLDAQSVLTMHWQPFGVGHSRRHVSGKTTVCGHTPQTSMQPGVLPSAVCIDTGIGHGGWLTCLDVLSGRYWQSNEWGLVRDSFLRGP
jgi:serine/threonine protein phosphatase 1